MVEISPDNNNIKFIDEKKTIVVGKSELNIDNFDVLFFAFNDVRKVTIPSCIKIISDFAFSQIKSLKYLDFDENSELVEVGSYAFSKSSITSISFPPSLSKLKKNIFEGCAKLKSIEFLCDNFSFLDNFGQCGNLKLISLPNCETASFASFKYLNKKCVILVKANASFTFSSTNY